MFEARVIPGYPQYAVTNSGQIYSSSTKSEVPQYLLNGYACCDVFYESITSTLPVHRAVALAWVENPRRGIAEVVNHKDGDPLNNWHENLEWVTVSENNYHAVNNGLRRDCIRCRIRDFQTGKVTTFESMAQAAEWMGLRPDTSAHQLLPKKFGALVADRFEVRLEGDDTPWFYESRSERVSARYQVLVDEVTGRQREFYSTSDLLKGYQLYGSPSKAIPELVKFAQSRLPQHRFQIEDSYARNRAGIVRQTSPSIRIEVEAKKGDETKRFDSLTECADFFNVDRSKIALRLNTDRDLDGWLFSQPS